jgi:transmembrane sensor
MSSLDDWITQEIPESIQEDAAHWMAQLDSEQCNEADRLAFARWLDGDPRHRWAFQELSEVWAQLRTLTDVRPLMDQPGVHRLPGAVPMAARPAGAARAARREWSTLLASAFAVLGLVSFFVVNGPAQRFATGRGEVRAVQLADGSTVELNARSSLEVDIDREARRVRLSAGDAVFHVAKDPRPFVVTTVQGSVAALGTSFAVQQDRDSMEVSVLEGRVAVTPAAVELPLTVFDGKVDFTPRPERAVLARGEQVGVSAGLHHAEAVEPGELDRELAWRDGYVVYQGESLQAVIDDMRRYSPVSIHLADRRLRDVRVSGRFPIGDASGLLDQLAAGYGIVVDRGGPRWVVLRAGPDTLFN